MLWLCADSAITVIYGIFKDVDMLTVVSVRKLHTHTHKEHSVCASHCVRQSVSLTCICAADEATTATSIKIYPLI